MDMICAPWLFSLLAVVIPIDIMTSVIENLLNSGWSFFYKLIIAFILYHEEELLEAD